MKRIEKIYEYLQDFAAKNKEAQGLTATEIADNLGFLRSNVSRELNKLYRMGKITKIAGRPVLYSISKISNIQKKSDKMKVSVEKSAFSNLIGANDSLKKQVEQAKAAVIYPPNGLHTLIVGQTGVGKTLLAHMMFEYGKEVGKFANNAPLLLLTVQIIIIIHNYSYHIFLDILKVLLQEQINQPQVLLKQLMKVFYF